MIFSHVFRIGIILSVGDFFSSSLVGRLPPKMGGACPLNAACIGNSAERASMYTLNILHASTDVNWMMRMSDEEESALKEKDGDAAEEVRGALRRARDRRCAAAAVPAPLLGAARTSCCLTLASLRLICP